MQLSGSHFKLDGLDSADRCYDQEGSDLSILYATLDRIKSKAANIASIVDAGTLATNGWPLPLLLLLLLLLVGETVGGLDVSSLLLVLLLCVGVNVSDWRTHAIPPAMWPRKRSSCHVDES